MDRGWRSGPHRFQRWSSTWSPFQTIVVRNPPDDDSLFIYKWSQKIRLRNYPSPSFTVGLWFDSIAPSAPSPSTADERVFLRGLFVDDARPPRMGCHHLSSLSRRHSRNQHLPPFASEGECCVRLPSVPITHHINMNDLHPSSKNKFIFNVQGTFAVSKGQPIGFSI